MKQEQLNELSIFSLRELARRVGVSSPTSKKKQQLIDDIIAINNGAIKPYVPKTKQGRPPKTFGYDVSSIFNDKENQIPVFSKTACLNQEYEEFEHMDLIEAKGVVEITSNGVGFLWVNKLQDFDCYFIPAEVVEKFKLESGYKILAIINCEANKVFVQEVLSINGIKTNEFVKPANDYYSVDHVVEKNQLNFTNNVLKSAKMFKGENSYVYGRDNNANTEFSIEVANNVEADNVIYINVSVAEKNKHMLKQFKNAELFVSKITDDLETSRRIVTLAIERAVRMFEQNKHVIVIVDDALSVASIDNPELPILRRLMSLTKNSKNASISIVALMDENKQINQIEKLADNKLII